MSVEMIELIEGPRMRRGGTVEFVYHVWGSESITDVRDALVDDANTPATYDDLGRHPQPDIDPRGVDSWRGIVRYGRVGDNAPNTNDEQYNFEIAGGTKRITQALATTRYPVGAPDTGKDIGVKPDGEVVGVDLQVPTSEFSITRYQPASVVDDAYQLLLEEMAYTVNDATFRGRAAGEVMFLGATGTRRPLIGDYEITYRFARRQNRDDIEIGSITNIDVKGWDYLEVRRRKTLSSGALAPSVTGVYVHTIYQEADFSDLEIPVA